MLKEILPTLRLFEALGGKAFVVGGYVRDKLLYLKSKDIDIEVYGLPFETIKHTLELAGFKAKRAGKSFDVLKAGKFDFSLPRTEKKVGKGYTGFAIKSDSNLETLEASRRRDFTMNAILYDPLKDEYIDHFGGISDIKKRIIRHVADNTFIEDPLRILRAAQFSARFKFTISAQTEALCKTIISELPYLSYERVFIEIEKLLMDGIKPSVGFEFLHRIGALEVILPEITILDTIDQGTRYHAEGTAFKHTLMSIDSIKKKDRNFPLMMALLLHDTGKALVESETVEDHVKFIGHEKALKNAEAVLHRLTTEKKLIEKILSLISNHMLPYQYVNKKIPTKTVRKLISKDVDIENLVKLHKADKLGRVNPINDFSYVDDILDKYHQVKDEVEPLVLGRHLIEIGLPPGKHFGEILNKTFQAQLNEEFSTLEDGLKFVKEKILC